jgi:3-deoxy-D-manno-octulosonate 8-phosphate phosphatase (KDO 8-P phosphatase)
MPGETPLAERARKLRWLLLDVDGVLTDGRLVYGAGGETSKVFQVRDGLAIRLAQSAGLEVAILSGRSTRAVWTRARELAVDELMLGCRDKGEAFAEFLARRGVDAESVAYVGDDLPDLPVLTRCGLAFAPADAVQEVRRAVDRVLSCRGGEGVVREMVEEILRARGAWEGLVAAFHRTVQPAG